MSESTAESHLRDSLTGVYSRHYLSTLLTERWADLTRRGSVALLIIDLDAFKDVNDQHGHLTGDDLLKATANALRTHFRAHDIISRYGGDEFVVVAPEAGSDTAAQLAERARTALINESLISRRTGDQVGLSIGFSIGVATYPADGASAAEVLEVADRRLYQDKRQRGRGRVRLRRGVLSAILLATLGAGLLMGSFVGAKVETVVAARPNKPIDVPEAAQGQQLAEAERRIAVLAAQVEALERAAEKSPAEFQHPDASAAELLALNEELARLRRLLKERPSRATPLPEMPVVTAPGPAAAEEPLSISAAQAEEAPSVTPPPPSHQEETLEFVPAPAPLVPVHPEYPRLARALRRQATVRVAVVVAPDGTVTTARTVGEGAGYGFDEAALQAARRTRFTPHAREAAEASVTYQFILR